MLHLPYRKALVFILLPIMFFLFSACTNTISARETYKTVASQESSSVSPAFAPSPSSNPGAGVSQTPASSAKPLVLEYLKPLYEQNPDLIGWLSIEGTVIDYPVMYSPQAHDFYLSHDFEKKKDKNGLLVLQADCDPFTSGTNLIIHGHKMKSGKMFGTLAKYKDQSYWKKHPVIKFDTLYARGEYQIFAAFYSKVYDVNKDVFKYYHFINANTEAELQDFITNVKKLALYDTGMDVVFGDTLITLSTCSYHTKDGRFVVAAKKIK